MAGRQTLSTLLITALGRPMQTLVAATLLAILGCYIIYYRHIHPLRRYDGPYIAGISNAWKLWAAATDRMPDEIERLHAKYGPVVRIGPDDLSFNTPEAVTAIYKSGWPKGPFYLGFHTGPERGLFSEIDEQVHAQRKRMFALGFAMPYIRDMEPVMNSRYAILRKQLDEFAKTGDVFDLRKNITYCIVDILGELAFGEAIGNQEDCDPAKIPPVSEALYGATVAGQIPWAAPIINYLAITLPSAKVQALMEGRNRLLQLAVRNVKARSQRPNNRKDMLGLILSGTEEKTGKSLTVPQTVAEAFTLLVGGTHTTGNALHCLFANLARHPEHHKRFVAELDERLPSLQTDQAAYGIAGLEEKLGFVNACIKENFRKDPVGTFNMPRLVPQKGAMIDGHYVAGGTQCSVNIHAFHHNPAIWGADHNVFNPNRWYGDNGDRMSSLVMPFGVGKRACVGQNLARTNVLKMATTLLRAYDFNFLNTEEPMKVVCHGDSDLRTPIMVRVKRRLLEFAG